jgi:hypothetical protein
MRCFCKYHHDISNILDLCTPCMSIPTTRSSHSPWWSLRLNSLKLSVRRAERKWRNTELTVFGDIYRHHKVQFHAAINEARSSFMQKTLSKHKNTPKSMWRELNRCVNWLKKQVLPTRDSDVTLAWAFFLWSKPYLISMVPIVSEFSHEVNYILSNKIRRGWSSTNLVGQETSSLFHFLPYKSSWYGSQIWHAFIF